MKNLRKMRPGQKFKRQTGREKLGVGKFLDRKKVRKFGRERQFKYKCFKEK